MKLSVATFGLSLLLGSAGLPAFAQDLSPVSPVQLIDEVSIPFETFTLANGLRVVVHTDHKAPVVSVSLWYDVGSKDEPAGRTGFAHLFEHLMFSGSANAPGEFFEHLKRVGATEYNGTTSFERTNYFETVPTNALERVLFLEADRMGNLLPVVTQEALDRQRGVVENEKRQGLNRPYGAVDGIQTAALFPADHPYGHTIIGEMRDLNAASLSDVRQWFHDHYGPNNAILTLSGDVDVETARRLVERHFGPIPRGPEAASVATPVPTLAQPVHRTIHDNVALTRLYRSWVVPGSTDEDAIPLSMAAWVLGGLTSSRLDAVLVREEQLAVRVAAFVRSTSDIGQFEVSVDVKPGVDAAMVAERLDALIAELVEDGPTSDELNRVATRVIGSRLLGLESSTAKGAMLTEGMATANDPGVYRRRWRAYASATPSQVRAASQRWLGRPVYALTVAPGARDVGEAEPTPSVSAEPVSETAGSTRQPARLSPMPKVAEAASFQFPPVTHDRLSNGVEVIYAHRAAMPITHIELSFDAGYAADLGLSPGAANMASSLLADSTARLDPVALAQREEELGALIASGASIDDSGIVVSTPSAALEPVLDLLSEMAMAPSFRPASIERQRGQMLAMIDSQATNASLIASTFLMPELYGSDHPYGVPGRGYGTTQGVSQLTRDDLVAFQKAWFRPDKAKIFVVSDRAWTEVRPLLEARFGAWRASTEAPGVKRLDAQPPVARPRIVLIDRKGAAQSQIVAAELLSVRGADDTLNLESANAVFGGSFTSRINLDLRQSKGWTYGASSSIRRLVGPNYFEIRASVQPDKTGASIAALRSNLIDFLGENGVTQGELEQTVEGAVRQLPGRFETAIAVLREMETNHALGRPDDYASRLATRYRSMTGSDLDAAARAAMEPGRLVWVVVGDAETVRPQLDDLGLPVEVIAAPTTANIPSDEGA